MAYNKELLKQMRDGLKRKLSSEDRKAIKAIRKVELIAIGKEIGVYELLYQE